MMSAAASDFVSTIAFGTYTPDQVLAYPVEEEPDLSFDFNIDDVVSQNNHASGVVVSRVGSGKFRSVNEIAEGIHGIVNGSAMLIGDVLSGLPAVLPVVGAVGLGLACGGVKNIVKFWKWTKGRKLFIAQERKKYNEKLADVKTKVYESFALSDWDDKDECDWVEVDEGGQSLQQLVDDEVFGEEAMARLKNGDKSRYVVKRRGKHHGVATIIERLIESKTLVRRSDVEAQCKMLMVQRKWTRTAIAKNLQFCVDAYFIIPEMELIKSLSPVEGNHWKSPIGVRTEGKV